MTEVHDEAIQKLQDLFPAGWIVGRDRGALSVELHGLTEWEVRDIAIRVSLARAANGSFIRVTR